MPRHFVVRRSLPGFDGLAPLQANQSILSSQPVPASEPEEEGDPIGDALRAAAVAYWKLNETSGTREDSKGNNDLTELNEVTGVDGAASFNHIESHLRVPNNTNMSFGHVSHAILFEIEFSELPIQDDHGILTQKENDVAWEYFIGISDYDPGVYFVCYGQFDDADTSNLDALEVDTPYFVIFEYDAENDKVRFFVNNQAATEYDFSTPREAVGDMFSFGFESLNGADSFRGLIKNAWAMLGNTNPQQRTYLWNDGDVRSLY